MSHSNSDSDIKKVCVIGSDARTHAIVCHLIEHSPSIRELWCAPGNAGIAREKLNNGRRVRCVDVAVDDIFGQLDLAEKHKFGMTIVSPEKPLVLGIADVFAEEGLPLFGCNQSAARFEGSKCFAQEFARKHGVCFAPGWCFLNPLGAKKYAKEHCGGRCVVKADGLRAGKGVSVCRTLSEAEAAIEAEFKSGGARIVIQELLDGREVSLMVFCDGGEARCLETAQDYKRAQDGNLGGMTGGMGAYSGKPLLSPKELYEVRGNIIDPWLEGCEEEGIDFQGVLYIGLMATKDGIFALEFNVRFGDPEAEALLPRLQTDLLEIASACNHGTLRAIDLQWKPIHSACVVLAKEGYPENPDKTPRVISGLEEIGLCPDIKVFHAGTQEIDGEVMAVGGRVLAVTGWSKTSLRDAADKVYGAIKKSGLGFQGAHYRNDIAALL